MTSDGSQRDESGNREDRVRGTGFAARVLANMALGLELQRAHRAHLSA